MVRQRSGRVINIASRVGLRGVPHRVPYCASKGGLILLTRALALEWAPHHILVNAVAPGLMNTTVAAKAIRDGRTRDPFEACSGAREVAPWSYSWLGAPSHAGEGVDRDGGWAVVMITIN
jgi:2-deoxy-D-gluconate 3-dehydrogenase